MIKYAITGTIFLNLFFIACSTGVITQHRWNKDADFGQFKTYSFLQINEFGGSDVLLTEENLDYVKSAIRHELDIRGYTENDNSDLLVQIGVKLNEYNKQGPSYGEGMILARLSVELQNAENKEMVWTGSQDSEALRSTTKREKRIAKAISEIFEQYTFRAGDPIRY